MITRYFISFNFAAIITFGLFFTMQMLINNDEIVLIDVGKRNKIVMGKVRNVPLPRTWEILSDDIGKVMLSLLDLPSGEESSSIPRRTLQELLRSSPTDPASNEVKIDFLARTIARN